MSTERAPAHLRPATQQWFQEICRVYELEEHHKKILTAACTAWDRLTQAREEIAKSGLTYADAKGTLRPHPAVAIERNATITFVRALRELRLDVEPPDDAGRLPRIPQANGHRRHGGA